MLDHSPVPDLTALLQQIEHGRSEPAPTSETAEEHVAGPMYRSPELAVLVAVTAGLTAGVCKLLGRGRLRWRVWPCTIAVCAYLSVNDPNSLPK